MNGWEFALRLIGAFYVFAGYVATRAALRSHVMDKATAAIGGKGLTTTEKAITAWHVSAATLVLAGGLALVLLSDATPWLFIASALGQAAYIYVVAPRWFDVEDPPDPRGRRQTTSAFVLYAGATALVVWANVQGHLIPSGAIDWPWIAAAAAALTANIVSILKTVLWSPAQSRAGDAHTEGANAIWNEAEIVKRVRRVKVMADYDCHPLWTLDDDLYGDIAPKLMDLSPELTRDLDAWAEAFTSSLNRDDPASSLWSQDQLTRHAAKARGLAERLARERRDLTVYIDDPVDGLVQVDADAPGGARL